MANQEVVAKGSSGNLSYFLGGLCFIGLCALVALAMYFFGDTGFWVAWGIIGFGVFPAICIYSIYLKSREKYAPCTKCNKLVDPLKCHTCGFHFCAACIRDHMCLGREFVQCDMCGNKVLPIICVKCGLKLCTPCSHKHVTTEHSDEKKAESDVNLLTKMKSQLKSCPRCEKFVYKLMKCYKCGFSFCFDCISSHDCPSDYDLL